MGARLNGKVAIVTGAAQGIGLAIARRFLQEGAKLALIDDQEGALLEAQQSLAAGSSACAFAVVSSGAAVDAVFDPIVKAIGSPTILVNNAGIAISGGPRR
jgi:NAD(P)-dependent dehydrogenase (short-subunit alcohol dehydrogenase family)